MVGSGRPGESKVRLRVDGERPVAVVQGRVEVEWEVDALGELPDEVAWYSEARMKCVKTASAVKVSPDRKRRRLP